MRLTTVVLEQYLDPLLKIDHEMLAERWSSEHFTSDYPGKWEASRLAFVDTEMVGYMIATFKMESVHVNRIAVGAAWRRSGIARLLLREVAQTAIVAGKPLVTLKVACQNKIARRFYQRCGFTVHSADDQNLSLQIVPQLLLVDTKTG